MQAYRYNNFHDSQPIGDEGDLADLCKRLFTCVAIVAVIGLNIWLLALLGSVSHDKPSKPIVYKPTETEKMWGDIIGVGLLSLLLSWLYYTFCHRKDDSCRVEHVWIQEEVVSMSYAYLAELYHDYKGTWGRRIKTGRGV